MLPRRSLLAAVLAALLVPSAAQAASAPDAGRAFTPAPVSQPLYGKQAPDVDPERQRAIVEAADGVDLYVETWLPAAKDGHTPPAKVPTILIATPYVAQGVERYPSRNLAPFIDYMNARGYAVAQHHIRGTGESGGCLEQTADSQIDDVARVIEYLGRDASWSDGTVGMYGHSYDAETQISTAGRGAPEKIKYLKAIVPSATVGGQYEYSNADGVPFAGQALLSNSAYLATTSLAPGETSTPTQFVEKLTCQPEVMSSSVDYSGDMNEYWRVREYRPEAPKITAATLFVHGLADFNVLPTTAAGFFDRLAPTTPRAAIVGQWEHNFPDKHAGVQPQWARADWLPSVTAWYDRWLKGLDSGADAWPVAQVQGSDGQWRAEPDFPTAGPAGQLPLGPGRALDGEELTFTEGDGALTFETEPLSAPLELTGQPVLDLWLTSDKPDAHLGAALEVLGPDGEVLAHEGRSGHELTDGGARSLQHLDSMPDGYFAQAEGKDAPTDTPIHVPIRLLPTDLVVPTGGSLRLTLAGESSIPRDTFPSGNGATITLLSDCTRTSALRFRLPSPDAELLNVRETDEPDTTALTSAPAQRGVRDGGIARRPACGSPATAPEQATGSAPVAPNGGAAPAAAGAPTTMTATSSARGTSGPRIELLRSSLSARRTNRTGAARVRVRLSGGTLRDVVVRVVSGRSKRTVLRGSARTLTRSRTLSLRRRGRLRPGLHSIVLTARDATNRPVRVARLLAVTS